MSFKVEIKSIYTSTSLSFCSREEDSSWTCPSSSPTLSVRVVFSPLSSVMRVSLERSSLVSSSITLNTDSSMVSDTRRWIRFSIGDDRGDFIVFCTCLCWCWKGTGCSKASRPQGYPPWGCLGRAGKRGSVNQPARPSAQPHCVLTGPPGNTHIQKQCVKLCQLCVSVWLAEGVSRPTSCRSWILVSRTCCMWSISCCLSWHRLCSSASLWLVKLSAVVLSNRQVRVDHQINQVSYWIKHKSTESEHTQSQRGERWRHY